MGKKTNTQKKEVQKKGKVFNFAIIGKMNIGKNFFSVKLQEFLKKEGVENIEEVSLASFLKANSVVPQGFPHDTFNYNYLYQDIITAYDDGDLQRLLLEDGATTNVVAKLLGFSTIEPQETLSDEEFRNILSPEFVRDSFTLNDIVEITDVLKRHESLFQTRGSLQEFGDYLKKKTQNNFYLSEKLLDKIKKEDKKNVQGRICTDTRFIAELLDFILNDYYIIWLDNKDLKDVYSISTHISELELNDSQILFGEIFDLYSKDGEVVTGIRRLPAKKIEKLIEKQLKDIKDFQGYSEEDKKKIQEIKDTIKENNTLFHLQKDLNAAQKELSMFM